MPPKQKVRRVGGQNGGAPVNEAMALENLRRKNMTELEYKREFGDVGSKKGWLEDFMQWNNTLFHNGWKGVKTIGEGGYGVVGHFRYSGTEKNLAADFHGYKDIVVKQSLSLGTGQCEEEGKMMQRYVNKCLHIIQLIAGPTVTQGREKYYKADRGQVERIYIEFMPGGDLWEDIVSRRTLREQHRGPGKARAHFFDEKEMWSMFYCLVKGVMAMHCGNEDSVAQGDGKPEVCHFDLKTENILLGDRKDAQEHQFFPVVKMGDFGLALEAPPGVQQSKRYLNQHRSRGTAGWFAPEQAPTGGLYHPFKYKVKQRFYGSQTNVWGIGMIMYMTLTQEAAPDADEIETFRTTYNRTLAQGETHGTELFTNPGAQNYSRTIRALVLECLMGEPLHRPTPESLRNRIERVMQVLEQNTRARARDIDTIFPENSLDEGEEEIETETGNGRTWKDVKTSWDALTQRIIAENLDEESSTPPPSSSVPSSLASPSKAAAANQGIAALRAAAVERNRKLVADRAAAAAARREAAANRAAADPEAKLAREKGRFEQVQNQILPNYQAAYQQNISAAERAKQQAQETRRQQAEKKRKDELAKRAAEAEAKRSKQRPAQRHQAAQEVEDEEMTATRQTGVAGQPGKRVAGPDTRHYLGPRAPRHTRRGFAEPTLTLHMESSSPFAPTFTFGGVPADVTLSELRQAIIVELRSMGISERRVQVMNLGLEGTPQSHRILTMPAASPVRDRGVQDGSTLRYEIRGPVSERLEGFGGLDM